jgi:hypothetical protein
METLKTETPGQSPPAAAPKGSAARLAILLGILAVVLGALAYDQFVAKPNCEAADKALEEFVQKTNAMPVTLDGSGGVVNQDSVRKHFGWGPTWSVDNPKDGYTIEYYCWWGYMPVLNRQRHFIAVLYKGKSRRYSAHYRSEVPPEDLPSSMLPKPSDSAGDSGEKKEGESKAQPGAEKDASEKAPAKSEAAPDQPAKESKESPASEKSEKDKDK